MAIILENVIYILRRMNNEFESDVCSKLLVKVRHATLHRRLTTHVSLLYHISLHICATATCVCSAPRGESRDTVAAPGAGVPGAGVV